MRCEGQIDRLGRFLWPDKTEDESMVLGGTYFSSNRRERVEKLLNRAS
jgi:hypothetical protein